MRYLFMPMLLLLACVCAEAQPLKPAAYYMSHPRVSREAKRFYQKLPLYQRNERAYYEDPVVEELATSILDSLGSSNAQTRPFYFYLASRNLVLTDGALLMTSIYAQYAVIREKPDYFFRYMLDNPTEKKKYFDKWASTMLGFADQYCPLEMQQEMDDCMITLKKEVMTKLAGQRPAILTLAQEFFVLMQLPPG